MSLSTRATQEVTPPPTPSSPFFLSLAARAGRSKAAAAAGRRRGCASGVRGRAIARAAVVVTAQIRAIRLDLAVEARWAEWWQGGRRFSPDPPRRRISAGWRLAMAAGLEWFWWRRPVVLAAATVAASSGGRETG